jgi:hypothetical protein
MGCDASSLWRHLVMRRILRALTAAQRGPFSEYALTADRIKPESVAFRVGRCWKAVNAASLPHQLALWQNGVAERLIRLIRRERLRHIIIWGEAHLRRILRSYAMYYNKIRTHGPWTKVRGSGDQFSGPEPSLQIRSSANFITIISKSRFSVHAGTQAAIADYVTGSLHGAEPFFTPSLSR